MIHPITPMPSRHPPLFGILRRAHTALAKTWLIIIARELITCVRRSLDTSDDNYTRYAF